MANMPEGTNTRAMSFGEKRVRAAFNPSDNPEVSIFKSMVADLIDACEQAKSASDDGEVKRLAALAQTAFEEGCMWAVKAVTAQDA